MVLKPQNLLEMLYLTVKRHPDKKAVLWKEDGKYRSITYFELWDLIRQFAFALRQMNVRQNTKVAIFAENGPLWLISDFAILSLGAVTVPIHPSLTGNQVRLILQNTDTEAAIVQNREMVERVENWPDHVKKVILIEGTLPDHPLVTPFNKAMDQGKASPIVDRWGWQTLNREDLATIVHTSGTTGMPKGVMLSHGNILANVENLRHFVPVTHRDIFFSFLPPAHIFERTVGQFFAMSAGSTIAYAENPDTVHLNMSEIKPTLITGIPRFYEKLYARVMESVEQASPLKKRIFRWALRIGEERWRYICRGSGWPVPHKLEKKYLRAKKLVFSKIHEKTGGNVRFMISGCSSLDPEISRFFCLIGLPVLETYGMTECSPVIACNPPHHIKPGTAGRPIPGTEVNLSDDGELLVKSPGVMMGYYKQPEETANTVVNGWLHTGDIAQIDEEGYLRIVGRKDNLISLSTGKNVVPQPVENALVTSRFIQQAVLVGNNHPYVSALIVPDYRALSRLARKNGWIVKTREEMAGLSQIRQLLQREMDRLTAGFAPFERPKKFLVLTEPFALEKEEMTPTQKVRTDVAEKKYEKAIHSLYANEERKAVIPASDKGPSPSKIPVGSASDPFHQPWDQGKPPERSIRLKQTLLNRQVFFGILFGILAGIIMRVLF